MEGETTGAFHSTKLFGWKFRKSSVFNAKALFLFVPKLVISLADQKTYEMAQYFGQIES